MVSLLCGSRGNKSLLLCRLFGSRGSGRLDLQVFSVRLRFDCLADDMHLNLIADLGHVFAQAEVGTLQRRLCVKADRREIAPRVCADLDKHNVEYDWLGHSMEAEIAAPPELIRRELLDLGALECRGRKSSRIEEIRRSEIVIEGGNAGV